MTTSPLRPRSRPQLRLELAGFGLVDPFELVVVEDPPGAGRYVLTAPAAAPGSVRVPVERAGLGLVGAGQALLGLSMRWMSQAGREPDVEETPPLGEVRVVLRRREARLLAALLRRHLDRLPQPPDWMPELLHSLEEIDEFLRWEDG